MTILYENDWKYYPEAIIDTETTNKSFTRLSALYRDMGISNNSFILQLHNPELQGISPFSVDLTAEQEIMMAIEAKDNFFYFLRECVRVPGGAYDDPIKFRANRGNIALFWLFMNHITNMLIQPRQTGKSFSTDTLMRYMLNIRCTHTTINLLTKDDTLRSANLNRLKELELELPTFFRLKTREDLANTEELTIKALKNRYRGHVPNKSPKMAMNVGRGLTSPIFQVDEAAFFYNVAITVPAALAAGTDERNKAKSKNEPYGTIFTTTAGKKDDRDGAYVYDLLCNSAVWTEKFFDSANKEELDKIIRSNSSKGELRVNSTFSHRQLGYTDEWLKEALESSLSTGDDANRDFFNIWTSGSQSSPISTALAEVIRKSQVDDFYAEISKPYSYITRWFIDEQDIDRVMNSGHFVLGSDTSDASGGDDISLFLRSVKTGECIAAGNYNETNLITFSMWVVDWLVKYENITLIMERRSTGSMILDYVLLMLVSKDIDPFTRIYNTAVQDKDEFPERFKAISKSNKYTLQNDIVKFKKLFGFATSATGATSRSELYSTTLLNSCKLTGDKTRDPKTIDQTLSLIVKNGRVDHPAGGNDDMCIAWLLSFWLLTQGKHLNHYNISPRDILIDNKINKEANTPTAVYNNAEQQYVRSEVERLLDEITEEPNDFIVQKLEHKLRHLATKLNEEDRTLLSLEELLTTLKEEKRRNRTRY